MKKEIIIFKDQKPTKEEICHSIEHFCMDHTSENVSRKWGSAMKLL